MENEKKQNKAVQIPHEEIKRQEEIMAEIAARYGNKKAKLVTMGCQQNESDSEKISGMLKKMGYTFTDDSYEADLVIFNTCAIRENAEQKVYGKLGALKGVKRKNPNMLIGVCGCLPLKEKVKEKLLKSYPFVDMVFGTHSLYKLPEILSKALSQNDMILDLADTPGEIAEGLPVLRKDGPKAFVSIMYGCNNFCSYCVVPYVRGRERSRDANDIIKELKEVASAGYKEVMLLGQNVNSYSGGTNFAGLLKMASEVEGLERIRFMTSHPKDLSDEVIKVMADTPNICNQLHLPVQSGSDTILAAMNRKYTTQHYMSIIEKVKKLMPDVSLSTDIIVGFPGETEEDFEKTLELLKTVRYDTIYSFIYSRRTGTPADKMENQVPEEIAHKRFERMIELQNQISLEKNKELVGTVQRILVEGRSKTDEGILAGRSEGGKLIHIQGPDTLIGTMVDVTVTSANTWTLNAIL